MTPFAIFGLLLVSSAASPAAAGEPWQVGLERGLPTYRVGRAERELRLVCDPDRVFGGTPNGAVIVQLQNDPHAELLVFLAETGEQVRLPVRNGTAIQSAADAEAWAKMVALLKAGGRFAIVTARDSLAFDAEPLPDLDCD